MYDDHDSWLYHRFLELSYAKMEFNMKFIVLPARICVNISQMSLLRKVWRKFGRFTLWRLSIAHVKTLQWQVVLTNLAARFVEVRRRCRWSWICWLNVTTIILYQNFIFNYYLWDFVFNVALFNWLSNRLTTCLCSKYCFNKANKSKSRTNLMFRLIDE